MKPIIINLFQQHPLMVSITKLLDADIGKVSLRDFPDGETYVKFETHVQGKDIVIIDSLDHPNPKILPLLFVAKTAKQLGANRIGLCAPYLAYMRQDKQFNPGEGVTSDYFAELISTYFDWLVTVDPHLHRHHKLSETYSISNAVIHAAPQISQWIASSISNPVLIGPDVESEQWVSEVAKGANVPYIIFKKKRYDDSNVKVSGPTLEAYHNHTPVLVDDIISTAQTMIETVHQLNVANMKPPVCIGVHAVFAGNAYESLAKENVADIVTCNTISHASNRIDLSDLIANGIKQLLKL